MTRFVIRRAVTLVAAAATVTGFAISAPPAQGATTWGTATVSVARAPSPTPLVTGVRVGRHTTFDRIVFDLSGAPSGYRVGYVRVVRMDGSGKIIRLHTNYKILVRLTPAAAHDDAGVATYTGPKLFWVGYPQLRRVAFAGDFEGVVTFGLGVSHRTVFRVFTLTAPTRIVVDLHH
jgi:hypothetical protein